MKEYNWDSINVFAKVSRQRDVLKRIKYVTNQGEKFICSAGNHDMDYWRRLALECDRSSRNSKNGKATQAREVILYIPNEFLKFTKDEQQEILDNLAVLVNRWCGTSCFIALHNSHATTDELEGNAHLHILISERPLLHTDEIKVAERNLFFDENNRRRKTKSEILDGSGQIKQGCYVVPKGEIVSMFGSKYSDMSSAQWTKEIKRHLAKWINETFEPDKERVVYTSESPFIPQQHVGKEFSEEIKNRIRKDNKKIKTWNQLIREGSISLDEAMFYKPLIMLSPERGREAENICMWLYHVDYPEEFEMPENMATIPRTSKPLTAEELARRELRRMYRNAQTERNLANTATTEKEKQKHQKLARHYSAEIDRMLKEQSGWDDSRLQKEMEKDQEELERLRSMIENTKYKISVYASRKGEVSLAKYRTEKRNLSDLYIAEKALVKQIAKNYEIMKIGDKDAMRKMDFSKRLESAEARKSANEESFKNHSAGKEMVLYSCSKAQAIVDSMQIQDKLGIQNQQELITAIDYSEKNLVRLKEALARCEDATSYYENKKRNCEQSEFVKISKQIYEFKKEQERICEIINSREQEYLGLQRALYGRNICEGISQDEYRKTINYNELFERHKIKIDYDHEEMQTNKNVRIKIDLNK